MWWPSEPGPSTVLKGPQALFYGKNSPGGVIAIHTADPGPEAEFSLRSGYDFEGREWRNEAIASGPVTDTLGVRLAAMYSDSDGYFHWSLEDPAPQQAALQVYKKFNSQYEELETTVALSQLESQPITLKNR